MITAPAEAMIGNVIGPANLRIVATRVRVNASSRSLCLCEVVHDPTHPAALH